MERAELTRAEVETFRHAKDVQDHLDHATVRAALCYQRTSDERRHAHTALPITRQTHLPSGSSVRVRRVAECRSSPPGAAGEGRAGRRPRC